VRDPDAAERARLSAAVAAVGQQITALDTHAEQLQRTLGLGASTVREERAELKRRLGELDQTTQQIRDASSNASSHPHRSGQTICLAGRPDHDRLAEHWEPRRARDRALPHRTRRS
jgi:hypothetical protein